jgi:hypothetical protein
MIDRDDLDDLQRASDARAGAATSDGWPEAAAMSPAELIAFLRRNRYAVLATSSDSVRASARPVSYVAIGASVWLATVAGRRLRSLTTSPWASLVVTEGDGTDHLAVVLDCPVTILAEPPPVVADAWNEHFGSRAEWAAWVHMRPTRLLSHAAYHDD